MHRTIAFFSIVLISATSILARADGPTTPLGDKMKQISTIYKGLGVLVNDPTKNQQNAESSDTVVNLFTSVLDMVPASILKLPADQQPAAIEEFKRLIMDEIVHAKDLAKAFRTNDNAGAAKILAQMGATKKEGHTKFAQ